MDLDRAREFTRSNPRAVMATWSSSGGIQQSPVLVGVDDEGRFVVSSRETAYKVKHLRRDPRTQLCILTKKFFGEWIYVQGTADILSLPEATEPLVDYYRKVSGGEHSDWEEYRASLREEKRVLIRVTAEHAGPDRAG